MFDDSYFLFNEQEEEESIPLPEKISVSTALEVVKIVTMETNYKLASRGVIYPSKDNEACMCYYELIEFTGNVCKALTGGSL